MLEEQSLLNDIAIRVGSYATTYQLARTAIGPFNIDQAVDLSLLTTVDDLNAHIITIEVFLSNNH